MNKLVILFLLVILGNSFTKAQEKSITINSGKKSIYINNAPKLRITAIKLLDENGNGYADAGENCKFIVEVSNTGKSTAKAVNILAQIKNGKNESLSFTPGTYIGNIPTKESKTIEIPLTSGVSLEDGQITFSFIAQEANNYDSPPRDFDIQVKAKNVPLAINWYYPVMDNTTVNEAKYTLKACILSSKAIVAVNVYVNGEKLQTTRGFKLAGTSTCNNYLEQEIELKKGENRIKIEVENINSKISSTEKIINYTDVEYEHRLALVIGNSNYKTAPLKNPKNDAHAMAEALRKLNFEVIEVLDGDKKTMKQALRDFSDKLDQQKGVGLFYYAGHGIQIKGDNYLVPVNNDIKEAYDVPDECIGVNTVLAYLESSGTRMNIVILDACRDNPFFASSTRSMSQGLAQIYAPGSGSIIAFATAPGSVAQDGSGENGLYTQELLKAIQTPGLEIGMVFRKVLTNVKKLSGGKQIPWTNSSIEGEFYFSK
jgi:hypothetical protein